MQTEVVVALIVGTPTILTVVGGLAMKLRKAERRRDNAETRYTDQQAAHEKADAESTMVTAIKEVLAEVREHSHSKDQELKELRTEVREVREQFRTFEHRVRVLLAAHGQWDIQVMAEVRKTNPDFPDPPPLDTFADNT